MDEIKSITIFGASICNFDCKFCFLHKNKSYTEYNKLISQAWDDGSYILNIKNTLERLEVNRKEINEVQIWGGESLLNISKIMNNLPQIYVLFPHIQSWSLSTNFSVHVEELILFLKELDKICNPNTTFKLQLSIDGPPGEISETGHNGWKYYEKNIDIFTNTFNNYKLKNLNINMLIHPTVSKEYYLKFSDYNYLKDYMINMYNFGQTIKNKCISESLHFNQDIIYPNLNTPYEDTKEDGEKIAKIFHTWDKVFLDCFAHLGIRNAKFYFGMGLFSRIKKLTFSTIECRELKKALTINYDGGIAECSGSFIDNYEPYLQELKETNEYHTYITATVHKNMTMYNPYLINDKELERKKWSIHEGGYRGNLTTYLSTTIKMANELAHSGQILEKYKNNFPLLYKHCSLLLNCTGCSRNNIDETRMPYVLPIGAMRRFLNGAIDYIYDDVKNNFEQVEIARSIL